jgi:hypothetical protein
MPQGEFEETKAVARLPNLQIEIVHGHSRAGDAERLSISVLAVPSFEAFGSHLQAANPFLFWMRFAQAAWAPWLSAIPAMPLRNALRESPVSGQIAPLERESPGQESSNSSR